MSVCGLLSALLVYVDSFAVYAQWSRAEQIVRQLLPLLLHGDRAASRAAPARRPRLEPHSSDFVVIVIIVAVVVGPLLYK